MQEKYVENEVEFALTAESAPCTSTKTHEIENGVTRCTEVSPPRLIVPFLARAKVRIRSRCFSKRS